MANSELVEAVNRLGMVKVNARWVNPAQIGAIEVRGEGGGLYVYVAGCPTRLELSGEDAKAVLAVLEKGPR